jgi:hypothetical protein
MLHAVKRRPLTSDLGLRKGFQGADEILDWRIDVL